MRSTPVQPGSAVRQPGGRRIPRPLDDWRAFDGWSAVALFALWGLLGAGSALGGALFWMDTAPPGPTAAAAVDVAAWSPVPLLALGAAAAAALHRWGRRVAWIPSAGVGLVLLLWSVADRVVDAAG